MSTRSQTCLEPLQRSLGQSLREIPARNLSSNFCIRLARGKGCGQRLIQLRHCDPRSRPSGISQACQNHEENELSQMHLSCLGPAFSDAGDGCRNFLSCQPGHSPLHHARGLRARAPSPKICHQESTHPTRMDAMPDGCRGRLTLPAEKASYAHFRYSANQLLRKTAGSMETILEYLSMAQHTR